jgi:hypothetical protein
MKPLSFLVQNLSADALKLFFHICVQTGCPDHEIDICYREIGEAIGRSERSLVKDKAETQLKGVCTFVSEANQHRRARVSIPQAYWPAELLHNHLKTHADNLYVPPTEASTGESNALDRLSEFGIHPETARSLIRTVAPGRIVDTIEYIEFRTRVPGSRIHSPQGMLIHYLRESVPLPTSFISTRQIRAKRELEEQQDKERLRVQSLECEYDEWCINRAEQELEKRYSEQALDAVVEDLARSLQSVYSQMPRMTKAVQRDVARRHLLKTIRVELHIPSFREWCDAYKFESHSETALKI